jgi:hypothetical protein
MNVKFPVTLFTLLVAENVIALLGNIHRDVYFVAVSYNSVATSDYGINYIFRKKILRSGKRVLHTSSPGRHDHCTMMPNICGFLSMEFVSCHPYVA